MENGIANDDVSITLTGYTAGSASPTSDATSYTPNSYGTQISGWTDMRITRGIERFPSDFSLGLTNKYPTSYRNEFQVVSARPGDACIVKIGADPVVTGYVDRLIVSENAHSHTFKLTGRGKCQDLCDCAAQYPNCQIVNSTADRVAALLADFYGIKVKCDVQNLMVIPQLNILLGETAYETIELICRYSGLLAYEDFDGSLILTRAGTRLAAGGFKEGINVEQATVQYSMDQRYSEYLAYIQAISTVGDFGISGNLIATVRDGTVYRHRRHVIIAEAVQNGVDIAARRAAWEMNRRNGRSIIVNLTTDSWRDADGMLWEPNTAVDIDLRNLKLPKTRYLISEVTYRRDTTGTHADLQLMAPEAFDIQPTALQPVWVDGSTIQ